MRTITTLALISCTAVFRAQDQVPPALTQRIASFADEAKRALAALDPAAETELTCTRYRWIDLTARALADELDGTKPPVSWPISELVVTYALANEFKDSDPDVAAYYQYSGLQLYLRALTAHASPKGHCSLVIVSDLARQADKARSPARLAHLHKRLASRVAELEDLTE